MTDNLSERIAHLEKVIEATRVDFRALSVVVRTLMDFSKMHGDWLLSGGAAQFSKSHGEMIERAHVNLIRGLHE